MRDDKIISRATLKSLEEERSSFLRIHRSYIVNPDYCEALSKNEVTVNGIDLPVGRSYRQNIAMMESLELTSHQYVIKEMDFFGFIESA